MSFFLKVNHLYLCISIVTSILVYFLYGFSKSNYLNLLNNIWYVNYENYYYIKIEPGRSERYMIKIVEMDEKVTISAQMEANVGPVILINKFNVKPKDIDQFLKAWAVDAAAYFKQQQGFISTQLHCGFGVVVYL